MIKRMNLIHYFITRVQNGKSVNATARFEQEKKNSGTSVTGRFGFECFRLNELKQGKAAAAEQEKKSIKRMNLFPFLFTLAFLSSHAFSASDLILTKVDRRVSLLTHFLLPFRVSVTQSRMNRFRLISFFPIYNVYIFFDVCICVRIRMQNSAYVSTQCLYYLHADSNRNCLGRNLKNA